MSNSLFRRRMADQGSSPGAFATPTRLIEPRIHTMLFDGTDLVEADVESVAALRERPRPDGVWWIDVQGLGDGSVVQELGELLHLHPLAVSDVVNVGQRPKVDDYEETLFFVQRMVHLSAEERYDWEQVSLFLGPNFVITFQETHGDCMEPLRERIRRGKKRIRSGTHGYLACMIVDAIVDGYFPLIEHYGDELEDLEESILQRPTREALAHLYGVKRDLVGLRRATWPLRDALQILLREEHELIGDDAWPYLRDTVDHVFQVVEVGETYRDLASGLVDIYLSTVGQRTNEVMQVLTVIATIFIPLTFIAGVYGMNFDTSHPTNLPELGFRYGYIVFWAVSLVVGAALLVLFRRLGWLGGAKEEW